MTVKTFARVVDDVVVEIIPALRWSMPPPEQEALFDPAAWSLMSAQNGAEVSLADRFPADFCAQCEQVDEAIQVGWIRSLDGFVRRPDEAHQPSRNVRIAKLLATVDELLNSVARAKGYDSIITAALRAGYPGPFHEEGMSFATWMDAVYAKCYEVLAQFEAGEIDEPDAETLLGMLPARVVP